MNPYGELRIGLSKKASLIGRFLRTRPCFSLRNLSSLGCTPQTGAPDRGRRRFQHARPQVAQIQSVAGSRRNSGDRGNAVRRRTRAGEHIKSKDLQEAALGLPADERAELARRLLLSLDDPQEGRTRSHVAVRGRPVRPRTRSRWRPACSSVGLEPGRSEVRSRGQRFESLPQHCETGLVRLVRQQESRKSVDEIFRTE